MKAMGVHRREKALYALMLCYGSEGLGFTMPRTVDNIKLFNKRMKRL